MSKTIVLPETKSVKLSSADDKSRNSEIEMLSTTNNSRSATIEKEKHKRVVTNTKKWRFTDDDYTKENQIILLKSIQNIQTDNPTPQQICVLQQLSQKIAGYKSQDITKNLYNPILFITRERVIELLIDSELLCHYCKKDIKVLYEIVREPLQWTLDRIDNDYGHNSGNLFISCLSCNLRRKTIYHERYVMTKICTNVVKLS
uniref:Uncharacterized protein n=1 Tax=viral metagenome TaxID=1070528 RepID=A0A6C0HIZ1_9ZZZZ